MAGDQPAKLCASCGKDVSNLPRAKDSQGRYICTTCQEQFRARKAAGPVAAGSAPVAAGGEGGAGAAGSAGAAGAGAGGGGGILDKLISDSPMINAQKCPGCGDPMKAGSVLCLRCGYDVRAGRAMKTRVTAEKAPKNSGPVTIRRRGEFGPSFGILLLIFCGITMGTAMLSLVFPPLLLMAYVLTYIIGVVGYIWGIVYAFMSGNIRFGIYGLIPLVNLIYVFWVVFLTEDKWSRSLSIAYWLGFITFLFMMFTAFGGPEEFFKQLGMT